MIGDKIICQNAGCEEEFIKKTHNQKYHDDECCRLATNAKIMEKYYEKKSQRLGLARQCKSCESPLSRYNSSSTCNACSLRLEVEKNQSVTSMLMSVIIGPDLNNYAL